ncbi:hypothetical protein, partial [Ferrovibrio sp.]|uniref:tetratricopeptide repeat protein n=1 Tax=Ferrovibrio sp. TaxID=1917215 RepID=UPI001B627649
ALILLLPAAPARADFAAGVAAFEAGDYAAAAAQWRPLAEAGDAAAMRNMGHLYRWGRGVPVDMAAALRWYRAAAELGFARAQANLAALYLNGEGVKLDYAEARKWFEAAARQGHAVAQYNLGLMHELGLGMPADSASALGWYNNAAKAGQPDALERLSILVMKPRGTVPVLPAAQPTPPVAGATPAADATEARPVARDDAVQLAATPVAASQPAPSRVATPSAISTRPDPAQLPGRRMITPESPAPTPPDVASPVPAPIPAPIPAPVPAPVPAPPSPPAVVLVPPPPPPPPPPVESGGLFGWLFGRSEEPGPAIAAAPAMPAPDPMQVAQQAYEKADYFTALGRWLPLAQQGNAEAQGRLGLLYRDGKGLPPDRIRALAWLRVAAQNGNMQAEQAAAELARAMPDRQRDDAADLAQRLLSPR